VGDFHLSRTDIEKNCAIGLLIDDMVLEDLVVQSSRFLDCGRHLNLGGTSGNAVQI
jgi:hypothetical protein